MRRRRHLMKRLLIVPAVFALTSAAAPADRFAGLAAEFDRQCASGAFSGIVVVRAKGRDLFERACGKADIVNDIPIIHDTRFKIFSTSKFMTALAVMRLVETGKLRLDDSIRRHVPDVPPEWAPVTIRQLLNHSSGVSDLTETLGYHFRKDHPSAMRSALAALSTEERRLKSVPGQAFAYNNFGFELLADAAANATGMPFADVLKSLVFEPAGMRTASVEAPNIQMGHLVAVSADGLAIGYNGEPGKLVQANSWSFIQLGAGAVHAAVDDFIALDAALTGGRIVSPRTLATMTGDLAPAPTDARSAGTRFGLGTVIRTVDGVRMEGHTGGNNGYISAFERLPAQGATLIVLSNRGFTKLGWVREGVAAALAAEPLAKQGSSAPDPA